MATASPSSNTLSPTAEPSAVAASWIGVGILLIAAILRLWHLDLRPAHFDEGINGMFVDWLRSTGYYKYDPNNYHGPLNFYLIFLSETLGGRSLWALRMPSVFFSIGSVWLLLKYSRFFGSKIALLTALGFALSPAEVYWGRDAIHEPSFVFFLLLAVYGYLGLQSEGRRSDLWKLGLALTALVLTKETYILHVVCFGMAILGTKWLQMLIPTHLLAPNKRAEAARNEPLESPREWDICDVWIVAGTGIALIVIFYSGFFMDFARLKGLYETFVPWFAKSHQTEGHGKPFGYWLELIFTHEPIALVGLFSGAWYLFWPKRNVLMTQLTLYGFFTLLIYSVISYKTPWCMISVVWPFFFSAAAGVSAIFSSEGYLGRLAGFTRYIEWIFWALLCAITLGISINLSFYHPTDENDPYVYVQTYDDISTLTEPMEKIIKLDPLNYNLKGLVITHSPHPIPWLIGNFSRVGYYGDKKSPENYDAAFLVVSEFRVKEVEKHLQSPYFKTSMYIRPYLEKHFVYFRAKDFSKIFPGQTPEFRPPEPPNGTLKSDADSMNLGESGSSSEEVATPNSSISPVGK